MYRLFDKGELYCTELDTKPSIAYNFLLFIIIRITATYIV